MSNQPVPDWDEFLSAAARLQPILPEGAQVGGSTAVMHVGHRLSTDTDPSLDDLRGHFDEVLATLEAIAGWTTARVKRPVMMLASLDGIETGIRQLIRQAPLETTPQAFGGKPITIPTLGEILRIKACLILIRNATRDYLDFVALAEAMGHREAWKALSSFDVLYPQKNGASALLQLQVQLGKPMPFDLEKMDLAEYKNLDARWHQWTTVEAACMALAKCFFDRLGQEADPIKE